MHIWLECRLMRVALASYLTIGVGPAHSKPQKLSDGSEYGSKSSQHGSSVPSGQQSGVVAHALSPPPSSSHSSDVDDEPSESVGARFGRSGAPNASAVTPGSAHELGGCNSSLSSASVPYADMKAWVCTAAPLPRPSPNRFDGAPTKSCCTNETASAAIVGG